MTACSIMIIRPLLPTWLMSELSGASRSPLSSLCSRPGLLQTGDDTHSLTGHHSLLGWSQMTLTVTLDTILSEPLFSNMSCSALNYFWLLWSIRWLRCSCCVISLLLRFQIPIHFLFASVSFFLFLYRVFCVSPGDISMLEPRDNPGNGLLYSRLSPVSLC